MTTQFNVRLKARTVKSGLFFALNRKGLFAVHCRTMPLSPHLKNALTTCALELGLLAAVWYFLGLDELLVGAIAIVIIASAFAPPHIGRWLGGVGMLGLAALAYFHYGSTLMGGLLAAFGVFSLLTAARESRQVQ